MFKHKTEHLLITTTFLLIISLHFTSNTFSQKQTTVDSLSKLLQTTKDSGKVALLRQLSWEYRNLDTSKAIAIGNEALSIAEKLNLTHEQADILGRLGVYKRNQGNFSRAMDYYFKGLDIAQKHKYLELQALEYNNIGDIYNRLGIYDQALEYVYKALNLSIQLQDNYNLSYIHHMLGLIYMNKSKPDSALIYFKKSLEYRKQLNLKTGIASSYLNIGMIFHKKTLYDSSFIYYNRALEIFKLMNDQVGAANIYKCIGEYYTQNNDLKNALINFNRSLQLIKGYGIPQVKKEAAEGLTYVYVRLGNFEKALYYQELATKIKDSISNNIYIQKITRLTENVKFEIKNKEQEALQKQKEELLHQKIDYQRKELNYFVIAFVLMIILIVITIFFYRDKNSAYKALNLKNSEIAELNKGLIVANNEIILQKEEIESQRDFLQKQHDTLEQLNLTKNKLFSIIAHDLRGPFSSIIGFSEMLKINLHQSKDEDIEEMIDHINQVGINTFKILDNLLNWAKTQINQVTINLEDNNISSIINDVIYALKPIANSKKIKINHQDPFDLNVVVDQNMVNTILRNLVSNSIKYSNPDSQINISVKQNEDYAEISVQDFGTGMSDEIKNSLFNVNVNPSTLGTANEKGTGLGMVICNEFIKILNGKIWIESEIGKGSTISFTLPLSKH